MKHACFNYRAFDLEREFAMVPHRLFFHNIIETCLKRVFYVGNEELSWSAQNMDLIADCTMQVENSGRQQCLRY